MLTNSPDGVAVWILTVRILLA